MERQQLHSAIRKGNIDEFLRFMCHGSGGSTLHLLLKYQQEQMLMAFLDNGYGELDGVDAQGRLPIHVCATLGYKWYSIIKKSMVQRNLQALLHAPEQREGNTPLIFAAKLGHLEIVESLCDEDDFDIDQKNRFGNTALMRSVIGRHYAIVRHLLKCGANPNLTNKDELTPVHFSCMNADTELTKLLFLHGATCNHASVEMKTPLHISAGLGNAELCEILIREKANVNACDVHDQNPLHFAARFDHAKIIVQLVDSGCDIDARTCQEKTPLMIACLSGGIDSVRLLLSLGADLKAVSQEKQTVLHFAALANSPETIEFLLNQGSEAAFKDIYGKFPEDLCTCSIAKKSFQKKERLRGGKRFSKFGRDSIREALSALLKRIKRGSRGSGNMEDDLDQIFTHVRDQHQERALLKEISNGTYVDGPDNFTWIGVEGLKIDYSMRKLTHASGKKYITCLSSGFWSKGLHTWTIQVNSIKPGDHLFVGIASFTDNVENLCIGSTQYSYALDLYRGRKHSNGSLSKFLNHSFGIDDQIHLHLDLRSKKKTLSIQINNADIQKAFDLPDGLAFSPALTLTKEGQSITLHQNLEDQLERLKNQILLDREESQPYLDSFFFDLLNQRPKSSSKVREVSTFLTEMPKSPKRKKRLSVKKKLQKWIWQ